MPKPRPHGGNTQENNHPSWKTPGCMSGILQLFSRQHDSHHRKRLSSSSSSTFPYTGKKKEKASTNPLAKTTASPQPPSPEIGGDTREPIPSARPPLKIATVEVLRQRSCDTLRSPSLPPEIRQCSCAGGRPRCQPTVIARLMGLNEANEEGKEKSAETAVKNRRQLLGALERCDEGLNALKRIIDAVRLAEAKKVEAEAVGSVGCNTGEPRPDRPDVDRRGFKLDGEDWTVGKKKKRTEINCEQPSPVSVFDTISSPNKSEKEKARDCDPGRSMFHRIAIEGLLRVPRRRSGDFVERFRPAMMRGTEAGHRWQWRQWTARSGAMVESVEDVWKDGVSQERWELGRVGVGLEGYILGDLVDEVVWELMGFYYKILIPLGVCRKRLCF